MKVFLMPLPVTLMFVFLSFEGRAQFQGKVFERFNTPTVKVSGSPITSPWCGGINSVQINHADLNNDGKKDLVLYDQNTYSLKTFVNTGSSGEIKYTYDHRFEKNFPPIMNYLILKDYNCDGIPDLFHKGLPGVSVFKGSYLAGELKFSFYKDLYFQYPSTSSSWVNVFVQPDDIPAIIDVDNDGDLDVVSFGVNGNLVEFVKNLRVEAGLPCDSMRMKMVDFCYGKFYQGIDRTVNTGYTCAAPLMAGPAVAGTTSSRTRHTGNCIALLDIEGDGDLDILGGNVSYNDAQLLINSGTSSNSIITAQDTLYQSSGTQLFLPSWPAPFHVDIDNDGDKDILFASHNDNNSSANFNSVVYYKNAGTDASPAFVYQHDSLLTPDMIDVGSYSHPAFFDYDKDGLKDLFIGGEGYTHNATGIRNSSLAYYKNTSTPGTISFELITKDFLGLSAFNYKGIFPTFGDLTGDGIDDLVMGNKPGYITVYKNYAPSNLAPPNFLLQNDSLPGITVGSHSAPVVFDFNQDGRTDLLVGNQAGYITYFQDTSMGATKKLALQTVSLGNIKAGSPSNLFGYCVPFIGKMDNFNKEYLLLGNIDGTIARYDNFVNNMGTFQRIDSNYSTIQTLSRSAPAVADLDGDGNYDMVIGNQTGGLYYYKQVKNVLSNVASANEVLNVTMYPNPATEQLFIQVDRTGMGSLFNVSIHDLSGKRIRSMQFDSSKESNISLKGLSDGMYFIEFVSGNRKTIKKFVKRSNP